MYKRSFLRIAAPDLQFEELARWTVMAINNVKQAHLRQQQQKATRAFVSFSNCEMEPVTLLTAQMEPFLPPVPASDQINDGISCDFVNHP